MRLIKVESMEMEDFPVRPPPYAILSHRWGSDEASYEDIALRQGRRSAGYQKIKNFVLFLRQLKANTYTGEHDHHNIVNHVWVDTCCIDKRSSADLSESINSMYRYYADAELCVTYLADVTAQHCGKACDRICCRAALAQFEASDWFRRGWTLQELIAPRHVLFATAEWTVLGQRSVEALTAWQPAPRWPYASLLSRIARVSLIDHDALASTMPGLPWEKPDVTKVYSIAQRLRWAAYRITTREEDRAYCLLGLLGVNMPLLYGEGARAWTRLQHEIIRSSSDESIFVWGLPRRLVARSVSRLWLNYAENSFEPNPVPREALSQRATLFENSSQVQIAAMFQRPPVGVTNMGIEFRLSAGTAFAFGGCSTRSLAIPLNCYVLDDKGQSQGCWLVLYKLDQCGH